jgi:hypothetical protein
MVRLAAAIALLVLTGSLTVGPAAASGPPFTVTPSTGIDPNGQVLTASATGWQPNVKIYFQEVARLPYVGLVANTLTTDGVSTLYTTSDGSGDWSTPLYGEFGDLIDYHYNPLGPDQPPCFNGDCSIRATDTISEDTYIPISFTPSNVDLNVAITDAPDPAPSGSDVTYTVTVSNTGSQDSTLTYLRDTVNPRAASCRRRPARAPAAGTRRCASHASSAPCPRAAPPPSRSSPPPPPARRA